MACCKACEKAQEVGEMPVGATCSPCANGACDVPATPVAMSQIEQSECPSLMLGRIDPLITQRWEQSEANVDAIALSVLEAVYPQTPDGRPIDWRGLSIETAACLLELRRRIRARVAYVLAHHDEDAAQRRWQKVEGGR